MSLENLFDFFNSSENASSGSIPVQDRREEDKLISRIIPPDVAEEIEALGPEYKAFLDIFLAVKGVEAFRSLDEKILNTSQNLPNTKKSYDFQKSIELDKFYQFIIRYPVDTFSTTIKKSSYKNNINYVINVLEYLISYYLIPEEYEKCAEIKKYIDFLLQKS